MAVIEKSIYIELSQDEVFDFGVNHPEHYTEWFEGVEKAETSENFPEVGSTIDVTYKSAGMTLKAVGTVVKLEPTNLFAAEYKGMANGVQTWTYEADGDGTIVTVHFDYDMVGGGLGKIVDKLIVERQNAKNFEQSLANLKAMIEG